MLDRNNTKTREKAKLETKYIMDIQWEIMIYEITSELTLQQGLRDAALTDHH